MTCHLYNIIYTYTSQYYYCRLLFMLYYNLYYIVMINDRSADASRSAFIFYILGIILYTKTRAVWWSGAGEAGRCVSTPSCVIRWVLDLTSDSYIYYICIILNIVSCERFWPKRVASLVYTYCIHIYYIICKR